MAKNRNKKKRNGAVSMDTTETSVSEAPQGFMVGVAPMDTSESGDQSTFSAATNMNMKQKGRPMKRSKNVRKMKARAKAISANEKCAVKIAKNEDKKVRVLSAKTLYE
ncbi:hypothetical protein HN51_043967 [Arachis hypogaea]|uniref:Uncharacterized protein n=1 Tax=Arachis hypogaea TaxID=3818 RepID=A0A444Y4Q9_ARAHY|nr:uncharacterized protein LOC107611828 [Arachis ipaensis]XP_025673653.1 uncharacterized protein LOC112772867 [Arachis hypogaea]QHN96036.1 hypothetical protein DS421_18g614930 [Arachis hypogaea]RYQ96914.1 hypothetical protein Ahy_B08g092842 [Arachis hypogaea]